MIHVITAAMALTGLRRPRLPGRHERPPTPAEQAWDDAAHDTAWQAEVVAPGPPDEFAPVPEPPADTARLEPLPAPAAVTWQPRPWLAPWIPVTDWQPEPATITDLAALADRAGLRAHVTAILARPAARSQLAQWVDTVMAAPYTIWSDATGSFTAVTA